MSSNVMALGAIPAASPIISSSFFSTPSAFTVFCSFFLRRNVPFQNTRLLFFFTEFYRVLVSNWIALLLILQSFGSAANKGTGRTLVPSR